MAGGNVFAVTFHCMVEGCTNCQQHYMTDREGDGAERQLSFRLFFCVAFL